MADTLFEAYAKAMLEVDPVFAAWSGDHRYNNRFPAPSTAGLRRFQAQLKRQLEEARRILALGPDPAHRLSLEVFISGRELELESFAFPEALMPIGRFHGLHNTIAQLGSGAGAHPFKTVKDYEDFLERSEGFADWVDEAIGSMREGVALGITPPRSEIEPLVAQLRAMIHDDPTKTGFWRPISGFPQTFSARDRKRFDQAYRKMITQQLMPNYLRLHDFIRDEYLPKCRTTVSLGAIPGGAALYAHKVRTWTTTSMTPAEIHAVGLADVARIQGELERTIKLLGLRTMPGAEVGYLSSLTTLASDPRMTFVDGDGLLSAYREMKAQVEPELSKLFEAPGKAELEIRAIDPAQARTSPAAYYVGPSPSGARPATVFVNTSQLELRPRWQIASTYLHMGQPGQHLRESYAPDSATQPRFRRWDSPSAYWAGWGIYAQSLGDELGVYADPIQRFGYLESALWNAAMVVVDTGVHHKGWTREEALAYLRDNTMRSEADGVVEINRIIALPAWALAQRIGAHRFRMMRERAAAVLGPKFDARTFHTMVLKDGVMPMDVLERNVDRWIESQR